MRNDGDEIDRTLQRRTGSRANRRAHFVREDVRERGLAESGRSEKKNVIERLIALARRGDGDLEIRFDFLLADVFGELLRTKRKLGLDVVFDRLGGEDAIVSYVFSVYPERSEGSVEVHLCTHGSSRLLR